MTTYLFPSDYDHLADPTVSWEDKMVLTRLPDTIWRWGYVVAIHDVRMFTIAFSRQWETDHRTIECDLQWIMGRLPEKPEPYDGNGLGLFGKGSLYGMRFE